MTQLCYKSKYDTRISRSNSNIGEAATVALRQGQIFFTVGCQMQGGASGSPGGVAAVTERQRGPLRALATVWHTGVACVVTQCVSPVRDGGCVTQSGLVVDSRRDGGDWQVPP